MCATSLYIHIPFCKSKCGYCSFISFPGREADIPAYIEAIKEELFTRLGADALTTIYIGGGTPSLVSWDQISELLDTFWSLCGIDPDAEITIETNPGIVTEEYLISIKKIGINRLSIGAQSLNDTELKLLGRIHTVTEIKDTYQWARKAGFENINLDLIYSIPGQTMENWRYSLEQVVAFEPEHISLYSLTLESNLPMAIKIEAGELPGLDPDAAADQYELAEALLDQHGYIHYEISNWAKPGFECRHNLVYWNTLPYLGAGVAAHSYLDGHRTANTSSLDDYISLIGQQQSPVVMDEEIPPPLQVAEAVILGLRLIDGISPDDINTRFGVNINQIYRQQIHDLQDLGLIEMGKGMIKLTPRGRLLGNEVFHRFLPETA
jgi:oxygen-independent coproporphyrinogen III oxidase